MQIQMWIISEEDRATNILLQFRVMRADTHITHSPSVDKDNKYIVLQQKQ